MPSRKVMRPPVCCVSARLPPESACQRSTATAPASSRRPCASDSSSAQSTSRSSSSSSSSSMRSAIVCRSKRASLSPERSGSCGSGSASSTPSTNWSQPRSAIASRSVIGPERRSSPDEPARDLRVLAELDAEPGTRDLRPDVRLVPVHPTATELDVGVVPAVRPGAATQPVARLEQERRRPRPGSPRGRP